MRAPKQANEMSPFQNDQKTNDNDINPYEGRTSVSGNGLTRGANTGSGKDELMDTGSLQNWGAQLKNRPEIQYHRAITVFIVSSKINDTKLVSAKRILLSTVSRATTGTYRRSSKVRSTTT